MGGFLEARVYLQISLRGRRRVVRVFEREREGTMTAVPTHDANQAILRLAWEAMPEAMQRTAAVGLFTKSSKLKES